MDNFAPKQHIGRYLTATPYSPGDIAGETKVLRSEDQAKAELNEAAAGRTIVRFRRVKAWDVVNYAQIERLDACLHEGRCY